MRQMFHRFLHINQYYLLFFTTPGRHCDNRHRQQERGDPRPHGQDEERLHRVQHGPLQHRDRRAQPEDAGPDVGEGAEPGGPHHLAGRQADGAAGRGQAGQPVLLIRPKFCCFHYCRDTGFI